LNLLKLEGPLGVQARPPHAGFFPLKFSTVPLLMKAARSFLVRRGVLEARGRGPISGSCGSRAQRRHVTYCGCNG